MAPDPAPSPAGLDRVMGVMEFLRTLRRHLAAHRWQAAGVVAAVSLDVAFKAAWPLSFRLLIDGAVQRRDAGLLWLCLGALLAGVIVATAAAFARDLLFASVASRVSHDVRTRLFEHLQHLSLSFFARVRPADVVGRFSGDLAAMEIALTWVSASLLLNGLNVLVSAALLVALEWRLACVTLLGLVACALVPRGLAARAARAGAEKKAQEAGMARLVEENVVAQASVKAFGLQERALGEFARQSLEAVAPARRFYFLSNLVERTPNAIVLVLEVVVVGGGVLLAFQGHLTLGSVVAFQALFLNLGSSVEGLTSVLPVLFQSLAGVQRIEDLLREPEDEPAEPAAAAAIAALPAGAALEFSGVSFSYDGAHRVLQDVDLSIPRGAHVALVGGSGSGKSTTLGLMLRFIEAQRGSIAFNGRDLRELPRAALRARAGVVFQENVLFDRSIRENIRLGRPDATDADVVAAARAADLHEDLLALPDAYATLAGERGARLSGGQRQRVAIARALIRNPDLLILDEATSALDPATEEAVNRTLRNVARGRTVVTVTHRLASITEADHVCVFQAGRVVERGRHEELVDRGGVYARLWRKQTGFPYSPAAERVEVRPEMLRRYPVLCELDAPLLEELAVRLTTETHPPDRVVVQEGDPGDRFYVIARGRLRVSRADGRQDVPVAVLEDGDHFGEVALLQNVPRTATVRTLGWCVLLSLQRHHFQDLVRKVPGVVARLAARRPVR